MSLWGKIAGGVGGLALGGPIGALLGVVAGHFLIDERTGRVGETIEIEPGRKPEQQAAFIIGVIALSAKMAKADGRVTADEITAFREIVKIPQGELANVEWVFDQARKSVNGYESYARQLARLFQDDKRVLEDLLDGLFHIARADGHVHEDELNYLEKVADIFGFSADTFEQIKARYVSPAAEDPYKILGIAPTSTDDEVKAAYRRLVKETHPDAMIARGIPEEFIAIATEKLAAINSAYETIEKSRGLK